MCSVDRNNFSLSLLPKTRVQCVLKTGDGWLTIIIMYFEWIELSILLYNQTYAIFIGADNVSFIFEKGVKSNLTALISTPISSERSAKQNY